MHTYNPASFTFESVKGEVSQAMHFDWKRDKIDDAKKRAIYEAPTYDDFTARVKGCTLKPIHKDEFNAPPKFNFNRQVGEGKQPLARTVGAGGSAGSGAPGAAAKAAAPSATALPRNGRELERDLRRRCTSQEKVALLQELDGDTCAKIFAREVDAELLRQMIVALEEGAGPGVARRFLKDLTSRCPTQTTTAATFLTAADRGIVAGLLARDPAEEEGEDVRMCAVLGVPPCAVVAAASLVPPSHTGGGCAEAPEALAAPAAPSEGGDLAQTESSPSAAASARYRPPTRTPAHRPAQAATSDAGVSDQLPSQQSAPQPAATASQVPTTSSPPSSDDAHASTFAAGAALGDFSCNELD